MKEIVFEIKQTGSQTIFLIDKLANETLKNLAKQFACTFRYTIKSNAKGMPIIHIRAISSQVEIDETIVLFPENIKDLIKKLEGYSLDETPDYTNMTKAEIAEMYGIPNEGTKKEMIEKING